MGGINQIINIYSNINRMTDQQKGYGLGIILGIRLPCLRDARAGRGAALARAASAACTRTGGECCGHSHVRRVMRALAHAASAACTRTCGECCGHSHGRPVRRPASLGARAPASLSIRISPLHTYDEINLIKTLILFVLKTI
ncbi:hypothetical protein PYW08_001130 [Mythimna loreyi]|uniref:Uncharacterized protein n=1 Tax=Mythimna loreyi TaxID=667449 RepID=A0ACC2R1X2_9NEOP|nr:hypothetical protein PYW08_001130 [Mythimna loreyi]